MSIIDDVLTPETNRAALIERYRELIQPGRERANGDADELRKLMTALGKTGEQVRTDAEALATVAELEAELAGENEAKAAAEEASAAWSAHENETKRIIREREAEEVELRQAMQLARAKADGFNRTRQRIGGLRRQHRELFGEQEPEAAPEPHHIGQEVARHPDPPPPITTPATFA